ncbi:MAG: dTDP-glucose 4,6-dehydratase [Fervidobacterium sp.]
MNVLITGCCGFIGTNFVYYYLKYHPNDFVVGLDKLTYAGNLDNLSNLSDEERRRFLFVKGDIKNTELIEYIFKNYEIDIVVNFAAESHVDRSIYNSKIFLETNIIGVQNLLDIAKKFWLNGKEWITNKKFIQISTDEVYGSLEKDGKKFTEDSPLLPRNPYAVSKAAADLLVKSYFETYGMPVNITRCSNNYGPYQFPEKFIPLIITNALDHKELPIYGDGKQIRDWIHVFDHCRAIDAVIESGKIGEVYNIGAENEWENIELVKKVLKILMDETNDKSINEKLIKYVPDRPGHDKRYAIDNRKIKSELKWEPKIDFENGIKDTIRWYLRNKVWIERIKTDEYKNWYEKNYVTRNEFTVRGVI